MKRFLLPLLAALALPTAVSAETVWLIVAYHGLEKIEMKSMEQCKEQGEIWNKGGPSVAAGRWKCLVGK